MNWQGLMKVLEIKHETKDGKLIWKKENLHNLLHTEGEEYILRTLFLGRDLPTQYYLGLDNRETISADDDMDTVSALEPSTNGYMRQSVSSTNDFSLTINVNGFNQANSPVVSFQGSGGSWGPVSNIFLTDKTDESGLLIASVSLLTAITVSDDQVVSMRLGMALKDCPT